MLAIRHFQSLVTKLQIPTLDETETQDVQESLEALSIAFKVAAFAGALLVISSQSLLSFFVLGLAAYGCYESSIILDNFREMIRPIQPNQSPAAYRRSDVIARLTSQPPAPLVHSASVASPHQSGDSAPLARFIFRRILPSAASLSF